VVIDKNFRAFIPLVQYPEYNLNKTDDTAACSITDDSCHVGGDLKYAIKIQKVHNLITQSYFLKLEDPHALEISNFSKQSITLEMNGPPIPQGQLVSLLGFVQLDLENFLFEAVAKVSFSEALSDTLSKSEFYLQQFEKSLWDRFHDANTKAQHRVDQLLKKMKGED
jgi:hypothetical protein